jgi:hypothetical protein
MDSWKVEGTPVISRGLPWVKPHGPGHPPCPCLSLGTWACGPGAGAPRAIPSSCSASGEASEALGSCPPTPRGHDPTHHQNPPLESAKPHAPRRHRGHGPHTHPPPLSLAPPEPAIA